ncbi:MAG: hypothetical protein QXU67_02560, partial [Candidatus Bathyarchaeia archaeon]
MSVCSHKPARRLVETRYIGIDISKARCRAAIMDKEGLIIEEFAFENSHEGIESFASELAMNDR